MPKKNQVTLHEFRGRSCNWIHVSRADAPTLRELGRRFTFHEHDIREVLPPLQHTKCIVRPEYLFLVLLFPIYDEARAIVRETELDVFLNEDTLITVNNGNELPALVTLVSDMAQPSRRELILSQNPAEVLMSLLGHVYKSIYPMLVNLTRDITDVENRLFTEYERVEMINKVLQLKTGNARSRTALQNHRNTLLTFRHALHEFHFTPPPQVHVDPLIAQTTNIWNTLEAQRESINALHQTNETLISYRINEIMKTLTIFAVIVFPLTLLAAVFGMNTVKSMPLVTHPQGFWIIVSLMLFSTLGMLWMFKAKRWL